MFVFHLFFVFQSCGFVHLLEMHQFTWYVFPPFFFFFLFFVICLILIEQAVQNICEFRHIRYVIGMLLTGFLFLFFFLCFFFLFLFHFFFLAIVAYDKYKM